MEKIYYYPGCTLKTKAKKLDESARALMSRLGFSLEEIPEWNCCGTFYGLAEDNLMQRLAPLRVLNRAKKAGAKTLATLCSVCYNSLKQANILAASKSEKLQKIKDVMADDLEGPLDYSGEVEVKHLIEILRDEVGFDKIVQSKKPAPSPFPLPQGERVTVQKIAAYYGCLLLRPKEVAIDDTEQPGIFEKLLEAAGFETVDFPMKVECCSSYQSVNEPGLTAKRAGEIIGSAEESGAEALVTTCPMCYYNLNIITGKGDKKIPVYYFTELLLEALLP